MAKDDYFTMVAKILVYLYRKLKHKTTLIVDEYLQPNTKDFPVQNDYFDYVLEQMVEQGLISGVTVTHAWGEGNPVMVEITNRIQITAAGIEYLRNNSTINKLIHEIPMAASIASLFE